MGFLSRNRKPAGLMPEHVLALLPAFGEASMEARQRGQAVTDPAFSWDAFMGPACTAIINGDRDRAIAEIHQAATASSAPEMASIGGYLILAELDAGTEDARYLSMLDTALQYMHTARFSSGHLTGYESRRWIQKHGDLRASFDRLEDVVVPQSGLQPEANAIQPGESRLLACTGPDETDNRFYAERRTDGTYMIYSERPRDNDDLTMQRYDEGYLGTFESMPQLLTKLGEYFGTPTYWADEDLMPYFPSRRA